MLLRLQYSVVGVAVLSEMCLQTALGNQTSVVRPGTGFLANTTSSNESLTNLNDNDGDEDYGDYDYYNVSDRAKSLLSKPHRIVALVLIFIVLCANSCSLAAICHVRGKLTSHFRLLISLACSDLIIAMGWLFHIINKVTNPSHKPGYGPWGPRVRSRCLYMIFKALNNVGLNIALLNLMGMAVDHYIAILRPLHHTSLMNGTRTSIMIVCLWIVAIVCGFSDFLCPMWEYQDYQKWKHKFNYCEFVWLSKYQEEYTVFVIALICFLIMLFMYVRIYIRVWRHQRARGTSQTATRRSKKTLITTLLILGTFMFCWLPTCIFNISIICMTKLGSTYVLNESLIPFLVMAEQYMTDLFLLNGVCDPIIYAVRIREIQVGYRILFGRCCTFLLRNSKYERHSFVRERPSSYALSTLIDEQSTKVRSSVNSQRTSSFFSSLPLSNGLNCNMSETPKVAKTRSVSAEMYG